MRGLTSAAAAVLCAIMLAALTSSPAHAEDAGATTCTGIAAHDASIATCGMVLLPGVPATFTWANDSTPVATAFAPPRIAFHPPAPADARPIDFITVWQRDDATGGWRAWSSRNNGPYAMLLTLERGGTYVAIATTGLDVSLTPERVSVFSGARVISIYGHPGVPTMGALGTYPTAEAAATAVDAIAQEYVPLSGSTRVVPALHLIVDVAQADPGYDGTYLGRMSLTDIRPYVEATRAHGQLLFLDVQVGWSDPLAEVQRLEPLLREPHVHVALDPEFATLGKHEAPGDAIGYLVPEQVNDVQRYLAALATSAGVPPKVLVLHQFRADMLHDPDQIARIDGVDLVIDMDGWGPSWQKLDGYNAFARASYAEYAGFKLFYHWDQPLMTPAEVMALPHPPDYLVYQ